jgi:hypothetical protein
MVDVCALNGFYCQTVKFFPAPIMELRRGKAGCMWLSLLQLNISDLAFEVRRGGIRSAVSKGDGAVPVALSLQKTGLSKTIVKKIDGRKLVVFMFRRLAEWGQETRTLCQTLS